MTPVLKATPNPATVSTIVRIDGTGFDPKRKIELALDGVGYSTNRCRSAKDGSFHLGITVGTKPRDSKVTARLQGTTTVVATAALKVVAAGGGTPVPTPDPQPVPTPNPGVTLVQTSVGTTTATVRWHVEPASTGQVRYGTAFPLGSTTTPETTPMSDHEQAISGLTAGTKYLFEILSPISGGVAASGFFTTQSVTQPPDDDPPPSSGTAITPRYVQSPSDSPPSKGGTATDPTTGASMYRITGSGQGYGYARQPAVDAGGTLFAISQDVVDHDGDIVFHIGGVLGDWRFLNQTANRACGMVDGYVNFAVANATTGALVGSRVLLPSGSGQWRMGNGEGRPSNDDRYVAVQKLSRVVVVDITSRTIVSDFRTTNASGTAYEANNVCMCPLGDHVVAVASGPSSGSSGSPGVFVYNRDGSNKRQLGSWGAHGDVATDSAGRCVYVQTDPRLVCWDLATGAQRYLLDVSSATFTGHVSGICPGRVVWSDQDPNQTGGKPGHDMTWIVPLDGSKKVIEVCHNRHRTGNTYDDMPMATISRDGTKVYTKAWDTGSVFEVTLP